MKILYLYSEVLGYTMATIRELANRGNEVHVLHWDHKKLTPYKPPPVSNIFMYNRSEFSAQQMKKLAKDIDPSVVVVSGWMDGGYLSVARQLRQAGLPVVAGFDNHWEGTKKQWLAIFLARARGLSQFFSHAWVAGINQFEYARRFGFARENIIYDLYSADLQLFNRTYQNNLDNRRSKYPHRFLFVGRFELIKGLDVLIKAWELLGEKRGDWELYLIGGGSLKTKFKDISGLVVKDFLSPEELVQEVACAGCFILPSNREPWGVVVHEFAAAGLPLITSNAVGASTAFLIPGLNGYIFKAGDPIDLIKKMNKIINMSDFQLYEMGAYSHKLSKRMTPETSAANLMSIVN